jgi:hypothetical protein
VILLEDSVVQSCWKRFENFERRWLGISLVQLSGLIFVLLGITATFVRSAAAETPPSSAPVSPGDIQQITRVIGRVTSKPILMIASVLEDSYVHGAVTGNAYEININTGERTPQYIRTDLVSVYMSYTDRSHVEVYTVRKVGQRWKIEAKKDWFL